MNAKLAKFAIQNASVLVKLDQDLANLIHD